jgi:hypothetical protein
MMDHQMISQFYFTKKLLPQEARYQMTPQSSYGDSSGHNGGSISANNAIGPIGSYSSVAYFLVWKKIKRQSLK